MPILVAVVLPVVALTVICACVCNDLERRHGGYQSAHLGGPTDKSRILHAIRIEIFFLIFNTAGEVNLPSLLDVMGN
jgi:hypothetical protein